MKETVPEPPTKLIEVEEPTPAKVPHHPLKALAEELETPRESLEFLNLFKKSAERVEKLSASLKRVSVFIGVVATLAFAVTAYSFYSTHVMAPMQ